MADQNTVIHLVSGKQVEVGSPIELVQAELADGGGSLVTFGEIMVNPAHVTHLSAPSSRGVAFLE